MRVLRWFVVLLFVVTGCGYQLQGSGSVLPDSIKKIYVPLAQNNTPEPGLAQIVTEAMRDRFERYGVLYVVDRASESDATLNSKILKVKRETRTVTSGTDTQLQLETTIVVACELKKASGGVLWKNNKISASKVFGTASEVVVTSSPDFSSGSISGDDLSNLDPREISRGQERAVFEALAEEVSKKAYTEAVLPEF